MDLKNTHTHTLNKSNQFYISKTVFREEKNTDMNAIKYATQPMIQITF